MKRLASLRSRLLVLVLVAVLPAFALTLYTHLEHRRAAVAVAHEEALRIARIAASEQNDVLQGARQLAFTLAQLPAVRTLDATACRPLLAELLSRTPGYVNISVAMPAGDVGQLTLKAYETDGRGAPIVAEVADTGPGIPPGALAQIWAPFYTTKAEGTGIGLSIVRSLVEQQPGTAITVESRLGVGTTFRLTM